jgi:hypothetical protein
LAEIPAVEELAEDIVNDGTPEAVLSLISVIVDPFELLEIVLDAGVEIGGFWISRPIDPLQLACHNRSN